MAKVILGSRPKGFKKELKFPMVDGTVGSMEVFYKYRTRKEFAVFMDEMLDVIKAEAEAEFKAKEAELKELKDAAANVKDGELPAMPALDFGISETETTRQKILRQADYIMDCISSWNLDVPLTREAVEQLADEVPAAASKIIADYRAAITEGHLGN